MTTTRSVPLLDLRRNGLRERHVQSCDYEGENRTLNQPVMLHKASIPFGKVSFILCSGDRHTLSDTAERRGLHPTKVPCHSSQAQNLNQLAPGIVLFNLRVVAFRSKVRRTKASDDDLPNFSITSRTAFNSILP